MWNNALLSAAIAFLAIVAAGALLGFTLGAPANPARERLSRFWQPDAAAPRAGVLRRIGGRVAQTLRGIGKVVPRSMMEGREATRLMLRAGFRNPETMTIVRACKFLLPIALVLAVLSSGIYKLNPFFILAGAIVLGYLLPDFWLTWRIRRRQLRLVLALADALDLLVVCVEAGLGMDHSLSRVGQEIRIVHRELSDELHLVSLEMQMGKTRSAALRELAERTGVGDLGALAAMLIQTDRFGTDLAESLRVHSDELRTKRRQRAEEMAAKATVKMVAPLVFFIFPGLFVVLLGPAMLILLHQVFPALSK